MLLTTTVHKVIAYSIHATTFTHNAESTTYSIAFAVDFNLYICTDTIHAKTIQ